MNILVAFGSTEGQTKKIVHHCDALIQKLGHSCVTQDCETTNLSEGIDDFDAVIVAGSVHNQKHQHAVTDFVKTHLPTLTTVPSAFVSVSLSSALADGKPEALKYVSEFSEETGWSPKHTHMAAGAIRFIEYDFFKAFTIEHIVMKGHEMPDKSGGNPEFTDWDALDSFVEAFLASPDA